MHNEPAYSKLIYEYFVLRFQFQYYKYGDKLPPIETLCRKFGVSPLTVKAALTRLQEEGYVSIQHGKCTQVTFQQDESAYRQFKQDFFADRVPLYSGFYKTMDLIFLPLYVESFQRMDEKDLTYLRHITERLNPDDLVNLYCFLLQKLENPLVLNLFWETSLFLGFPSLNQIDLPGFYSIELMKKRISQLITSGQKKDHKLIIDSQGALERDISEKFIDYLAGQTSKETVRKPISFRWRIYRDRPQICYNLATRILHHIYLGEYRKESFLPSYQTMADKYRVSLSTIRRTIRLLNEIGAVHSINGKGTHILSFDEQEHEPNFDNPAIRRNLAYFINAFEILKFSIEGISRITLPVISPSIRNDLIKHLESHLQSHSSQLASNELLVFISTYSPLPELREVYEKLYRLMLWGVPLLRHRREESGIEETTIQFTKQMIASLKKEDFNGCAKLLGDLYAQQYPIAEAYLYRRGLKPEELRCPPAIRLAI